MTFLIAVTFTTTRAGTRRSGSFHIDAHVGTVRLPTRTSRQTLPCHPSCLFYGSCPFLRRAIFKMLAAPKNILSQHQQKSSKLTLNYTQVLHLKPVLPRWNFQRQEKYTYFRVFACVCSHDNFNIAALRALSSPHIHTLSPKINPKTETTQDRSFVDAIPSPFPAACLGIVECWCCHSPRLTPVHRSREPAQVAAR